MNAPSVFDYLWSAVKPLAVHTQHKIKIFSDREQQYSGLQRLLEDEDIPDFLVPGRSYARRKDTVTTVDGFLPDTVKQMDEWLKSLSNDASEDGGKNDEEVGATIDKMSAIEIKEDYCGSLVKYLPKEFVTIFTSPLRAIDPSLLRLCLAHP